MVGKMWQICISSWAYDNSLGEYMPIPHSRKQQNEYRIQTSLRFLYKVRVAEIRSLKKLHLYAYQI